MNLHEIILSLEGKTEHEAKFYLRQLGVDKSLHHHILGCYKKNSRKLKAKHVGL